MPGKKFLFAVQGEGRGHLTQAIAVYEMLIAEGHQVVGVMIGMGKGKTIPAFVRERIRVPIILLESPHFIKDKHNRAVSIPKTFLHTCKNILTYKNSIQTISYLVKQHQPDVLLNFYEPLVGITALFSSLDTVMVSVAHQYIYLHPDFLFPEGSSSRKQWMIRQYTRLTAYGSAHLLALSFYPMQKAHYANITICPPLLRKEIMEQEIFAGRHLLVYLVNAGYMSNIIRWHEQHPEYEVHCFTDSSTVKGKWQYRDNLYFHSLDDRKFMYYMANAQALITTAGFESVCEAIYMGKPVLMVPVENHFEQWCNARDAASCGAGIYSDQFNIDLLREYLPEHKDNSQCMRDWVGQAIPVLSKVLESITNDLTPKNQQADPVLFLDPEIEGSFVVPR